MTITQKYSKQSITPTGPNTCELLLMAAHSADNKIDHEHLRSGAIPLVKISFLIDAKTAEEYLAKSTEFSLVLKSLP